MSFTYLASPYSDPDGAMREQRFLEVEHAVAVLLRQGRVVFSPIVHCHELSNRYILPGNWEFWSNFCLGMLEHADELLVLATAGYSQSHGVNAEIDEARRLNKRITFVYPEELFADENI